ncbi:MAG TPA: MarR family transcriptional regulator [Fibrobacteria bacterium]|nr:MarR family transcriptional regulator [Fibrobacteria bacterium]
MIRTYDYLQTQVASLLQRHNLTVPQFEVLSTLAIADCTTQQELAQRLQVTKGNLVGLIDRLTERGWVERMQVQSDRRVNRVRITEGGKELLDKAFPEQVGAVETMMSGLADTELDSLRGLLQKLVKTD